MSCSIAARLAVVALLAVAAQAAPIACTIDLYTGKAFTLSKATYTTTFDSAVGVGVFTVGCPPPCWPAGDPGANLEVWRRPAGRAEASSELASGSATAARRLLACTPIPWRV